MFFNVYVIIEIPNVVCIATDIGDEDDGDDDDDDDDDDEKTISRSPTQHFLSFVSDYSLSWFQK